MTKPNGLPKLSHDRGIITDQLLAAYAAGVLDGEGCFRIDRFPTTKSPIGFQFRTVVEICMCDEGPIRKLAEASHRNYSKKKIPSGRTAYYLTWRNGIGANLIRSVLPYLVGKKEQAELCLHFEENITPGRGRTYKPGDREVCDDIRDRVAAMKRFDATRC